jgi:hypothetical protein
MHRVELILEVNKKAPGAAAVVARIKSGEPLYVSMGCKVDYDVCSICGNMAKNRLEYCDHLKTSMGRILSDGRQVFTFNPDPVFFDISLVTRPADPTAFALDKMAGEVREVPADEPLPLEDLDKLSALRKFSDILKHVDGEPVEGMDEDGIFPVVRGLAREGFQNFGYPGMDEAELAGHGVSPAGLAMLLACHGAPLTLGDAAYMAGRHVYGDRLNLEHLGKMFSILPVALSLLEARPSLLDGVVGDVLSDYAGELDNERDREVIVRMVRPVTRLRITLFRALPCGSEKRAAFAAEPSSPPPLNMVSRLRVRADDFSPKGSNFTPVRFTDSDGNVVETAPWFLRQARLSRLAPTRKAFDKLLGAALAMGAVGVAASDAKLVDKLLGVALLSLPAGMLLTGAWGAEDRIIHGQSGEEVPARTLMESWKMQKSAGKIGAGVVAGVTLPAALALDYAYNRWKYAPYGGVSPEAGRVRRAMLRAGQVVTDHPVTSSTVGGVMGAAVPGILKAILKGKG